MSKLNQKMIIAFSVIAIFIITSLVPTKILAQTVTDPSNTPGYDSLKLSNASPGSSGRSIQNSDYNYTLPGSPVTITGRQATSTCWLPSDGTFTTFAGNDDGSIGPFALAFPFNLYGTNYTQVWINNNGNLTFTGAYTPYTASGFPFNVPMVAPFWSDVDTRPVASGKVKYKINPTNVIVTYENVGYYNNKSDKLNTFEVIITNGNDPIIGIGNNVAFYYKDMQWTTGDVSGGVGGFGGTPATVGVNKGNSINYVQIGRFGLNSDVYDGGGGNTDGINYLDNECFTFNVSNAVNQPPSVNGVPPGNIVNLACGETKTFTLSFNPPEVGQSVSTTVNTGGLCNTTVSTTSGAVSTATVTITGTPCNEGSNTITYTATDNFNPTPATTTVSLTINVAPCCVSPVITCPANINVNNDAGICGATVSFAATATGTSPVITYSKDPGTIFNVGTTTVTATATNSCGTSSCTFDVIVTDNETPVLTAGADQDVNLDGSCSLTVPDVRGTATDNCTVSITQSPAAGTVVSSAHNGTVAVTVTATDGAGLTDVKTVTLTAKDISAPALTAGANQDVNLNGSCSIVVPDVRGTATDNCTVSIAQSPAAGDVVSSSHNGNVVVTVTATDAAGLTDVKTVTLTAKDVTAPALTAGADQDVNLDGSCSVTIPDVRGTATDNCTVSITQSPAAGTVVSSLHNGTISVTVTATDGSGLTDVKTVTLTAKDVTAPALTAGADQDVNLDGSCSIKVPDVRGTATDNCTVSIAQSPAAGTVVSSSHNGTVAVTVTATDGAGLTDVKTVTLTAKDVTAPALTAGANQDVNLNGSCSIVVPDVRGTATDNCTVSIAQSPAAGDVVSSSHNGNVVVTVTATDGAGLTDVKNVTLTAKDISAPALTAGANQDVNLNGSCSIIVPDVRGTATDNCTVSIAQSPAAGNVVSSSHNGTISVTVTATDGAGLTDVKIVTLTAKDVSAPALTAGADQDVNLNGSCSIIVPDVRGTATDNCTVSIAQSPAAGTVVSSSHNGTVSVTVTATDGAGLTDVKTVTMTAKDITSPTITCPGNIVLSACQSTATWAVPTGNDNCSGWTISRSGPAPGSTFANGSTTTITYTATDLAGNTANCSFTVKRDATLGATVTNNNPVLYFGFTLDQLAKITTKPSGGTGPYTVAYTMNRPINCNLVNSSGDEIWTRGANTSLDSNITCVSTTSPNTRKPGSTSTNTITSATGYSLDVTLMQDATIYITVTDSKGCKYLDSTKIHAEDVRCFAGNSNNAKVTVCHRTNSASNPCVKICIDQNAVQEHLSHGDFLGNCTPGCVAPTYTRGVPTFVETTAATLDATVMPNPTTSFFEVAISAKKGIPVTMTVNDVYGRLIQKNTKVDANKYNQLGQNWKAGTYFIEVMQGNERKVLKVIKTN